MSVRFIDLESFMYGISRTIKHRGFKRRLADLDLLLEFVASHFLGTAAVDSVFYQCGMVPCLALNTRPSRQKRRFLGTYADNAQFACFT